MHIEKNRIILMFLMVYVFAFIALNVQAFSMDVDPETLQRVRDAPRDRGAETGALILLRDCRFEVDEDGNTVQVIRVLGKVFNKQARSDYSQIPVGFNSYYENIKLDFARTIRDDGSVQEVPNDAVQIKTIPDASGGILYTDNRNLTFALSGLEVGVAFEYQITVNQKVQAIEGEWFDNHMFGYMLRNLAPPYIPRMDPVLVSRYTLCVTEGTEFQYHLSTSEEKPKKSVKDDLDIYFWELNDIASLSMEGAMPPLSELRPVLLVGSLDNWEQFDKWAYRTLLSKVETNDEIITRARSLVSDNAIDEEKIKAIFHFIQNNIQYLYADLGRGGYAPHPASEVLKTRYGDCKDQTILFISLLRAVGIEAYPALLSPFPYDEFVELPAPYFTHLITYIPRQEGDLWLDSTPGVTSYPNLFYANQNRSTFIVNGKGGMLVRTRGSKSEENVSSSDLRISFNNEKAKVNFTFDAIGAQSDVLKSGFQQVSIEQQRQYFKSLIISKFQIAKIDTIYFSDCHDPNQSFNATVQYHIDSTFQKGIGTFNYDSHASIPLTLFANIDVSSFSSNRHHDILGSYLFTVTGSENYVPPQNGFINLFIPSDDSLDGRYFCFKRNFDRKDDIVSARWTLVSKVLRIPVHEYDRMCDELRDINKMVAWRVTYLEPSLLWNELQSTENPISIIEFCNDLLEKDSLSVLAFLLRGRLYHVIGRFQTALDNFDAAYKISPNNKYVQLWSARSLLSLRNTEEAFSRIERAVSLDSTFEDAYTARGGYYLDEGHYEKGLDDFNIANRLNPSNVFALRGIGCAQRGLSRYNESIIAFKNALAIDSTSSRTYEGLADTYTAMNSLKDATKAYLRAIELNPNSPHSYGNLGWVYYLKNDMKKCIEYSSIAVVQDSMAYYAKYNIALAKLRSGRFDEAYKLYEDLRIPMRTIPQADPKGAIEDLKNLIAKGIRNKEAAFILEEIFNVKAQRK